MYKICLIFVLFLYVNASSSLNKGIFYFVGPDCHFKSANEYDAHVATIENYQLVETERPCENIASTVYQNSKGNHLIVIKYESAKEISVMIWQINGSTNVNLRDSFNKINYEYMLGDYCSFDKTLLSIGIDSNMLYTTVKCGGDTWAFMRSILTLDGNFYTPSGPLIYFKNGDSSFDRLLFLSTDISADMVVMKYQWTEGGNLRYISTYLHQLNNTNSVMEISFTGFTKSNIFSYLGGFAYFGKLDGLEKTEIKIYDAIKNPMSTLEVPKKIRSKDYTFVKAWGFYPELLTKTSKVTWKIRDSERVTDYVSEECITWNKEESAKDGCIDDNSSSPWFFYLIAGIEFAIFLAALVTLITLIVLKRKKRMSKIISKREGPAVTQIATVVSTQIDDVTNTTNTNNV